jgi:glucuronate isomerase
LPKNNKISLSQIQSVASSEKWVDLKKKQRFEISKRLQEKTAQKIVKNEFERIKNNS